MRFALVQGLHLPSTYRKLGTIEAEVRRRAYAGALSLEATTAATLGLPPTLLPNTDISPTSAFNDGSTANFFSLSHALYGVQLQIIHELYNGKPTLHESTLRLERQLDTLALSIPAELHLPVSTGRPSYSGSIYQALVLQTRLLNTRQLLHRPLLSSLSRGDRADHDGSTKIHTQLEVMMARASARLCCDAAVKMLEIVADGETSYLKGPWCRLPSYDLVKVMLTWPKGTKCTMSTLPASLFSHAFWSTWRTPSLHCTVLEILLGQLQHCQQPNDSFRLQIRLLSIL